MAVKPVRAPPHPKPLRRRGAAKIIDEAPASGPTVVQIVEHPDGFYWIAPDGAQAFGPFETAELAREDHDRFDEESPTPGETLQEAESDIGIADWIDPQTGEPAEGQSPPHLQDE